MSHPPPITVMLCDIYWIRNGIPYSTKTVMSAANIAQGRETCWAPTNFFQNNPIPNRLSAVGAVRYDPATPDSIGYNPKATGRPIESWGELLNKEWRGKE